LCVLKAAAGCPAVTAGGLRRRFCELGWPGHCCCCCCWGGSLCVVL
jgi:hypothetical protein